MITIARFSYIFQETFVLVMITAKSVSIESSGLTLCFYHWNYSFHQELLLLLSLEKAIFNCFFNYNYIQINQ